MYSKFLCFFFLWGFALIFAQKELALEGPILYEQKKIKLHKKTYSWEKVDSIQETEHPLPKNKWQQLTNPPKEIPKEVQEEYQKKVQELIAQQGNKAEKNKLAVWCKKNNLYPQHWEWLSASVVEDGWYSPPLKHLLELTEYRFPKTIGIPPFEGLWEAFEDTTKHHQQKCWAHWAIDFVKVDENGRDFRGNGTQLTDHYSWEEPIYAFANGTVIHVANDFPDLPINKLGGYDDANLIMLQHEGGEYSSYVHLQKGSITVTVGEEVKQGQFLGKVGNSGRSGMPHLHFALMIVSAPFQGQMQYIGVPYLFENFSAYPRKDPKKKKILMKRARPQEGWILECTKPKISSEK